MSKAPTVKTSEMSELLDTLTVVVHSGIPTEAMQREVIRVARQVLKLHQATLAAKEQAERERDEVRHHRDALYKMASEDFVKVRDWLRDPGRRPASAAFTAGIGRDAATAVEDSGVLDELAQLRERVRALADAADVYAADQSAATDPRCGLSQLVTVAEAEALNDALAAARAILTPPEAK